jgi:uncharacterized protein with ParB-like and HNH nuclease domain
MKAEETKFLNFLNSPKQLMIPIYQRAYSWKLKECKQLWSDILRAGLDDSISGHFMGSVVYVEKGIYQVSSLPKLLVIDGQQRLTTLYLIHWYLCLRDNNFEEYSNVLSRFTYKTRTTSKDFCLKLTEKQRQEDFWNDLFGEQEVNDKKIKPSHIIENQPWFFLNWRHDPTIDSILNMLDDIHLTFRDSSLKFVDLIDSEKRFIIFHFLPINTYGRSDGLYVKMNARGKVLTDFENFKAKFENFLRENHESYLLTFTERIDGEWCDLFWSFIKSDEQIEAFDRFDLVDTPLLNFISYITEMLFYKEQLNEEKDFDNSFNTIKEVYASGENVQFLFDAFETFARIGKSNFKEKIQDFFDSVFCLGISQNKVSLFDGSINLFKLCLFRRNKFDIREKSLLFGLIHYLKNTQENESSDNLRDYIRICRNYLLSINQKSKDSIISELRKEYYYNIICAFEKIYDSNDVYGTLVKKQNEISFKAETIEHEVKKSELFSISTDSKSVVHRLEDSSILQGTLTNLIPDSLDGFDFEKRVADFEQVWAIENDGLISRALLSTGDYSEKIATSNFGDVRFFGKGKKWSRLLMSRNGIIHSVLQEFFSKLSQIQGSSIEERLINLINHNIENREFEDWEKLFVDHPSILSSKKNIFVFNWNGRNDYRVELLTGTTLGAYHINAYAFAVIQEINNNSLIDSDKSYSNKSDPSCLQLTNGVKLFAQTDSWLVENVSAERVNQLQNQLNLIVTENGHLELRASDKIDYINIAKKFIEKIFE